MSVVFVTQPYFLVLKDVRLNTTHYLLMNIHNKTELQNIAINHSKDIDYKDFMKIYKESTSKPYSYLTNDTTLPADDLCVLRKIF